MKAPRIAISGVVRTWDGLARAGVNAAYLRAVSGAGGIPIIASQLVGQTHAADLLDGAEGLVLTGGEDVHPDFYREAPSEQLGRTDRERDLFEIALLADARARGMPVLGICRGIQLVNVALGGTLWQDLPSQRPGTVAHAAGGRNTRSHAVRMQDGSGVADALGVDVLRVNSVHHQGVKDLAPGLKPSAWAEDGLVEAVEDTGDQWLMAVQWHPEEMHADASAPDRGLFRGLIREAVSWSERSTARSLR